MQIPLLAALAMATLALAGCSNGGGHATAADVNCPDGTVLTGAQVEASEGHHAAGFDAATLCPIPPKVALTGLPATLQVYGTSTFNWSVDPGSITKGHSMLTSIRYAMAPVADAQASLESYNKEVLKKEHQDLPVAFRGNLTFNVPGKIYLRAYAQVQGEGYERREIWSPEVVLDVLPVTPTGVTHTVTHAVGPLGALDPSELTIALGDALVFQNDDLMAHALTGTNGPAGSVACELSAGAGAASEPCLFVVPGSYSFTTNDVQAKTLQVSVRPPV